MEINIILKEVSIKNDYKVWDKILENSPDFYTISHNPSLVIFLEKTLKWSGKSFFILFKDEIIGIYQHCFVEDHKVVSMPHFSYGGIVRKDEKYKKEQIFNSIIKFLPKYFEVRDFVPYSKYFKVDKVATYLELKKTHDEQLASFKYNHRRKIKKAYKNGLNVIIANDINTMKSFYKVYCKNMLRLGSPPLSEKFFLNLLNTYKFGNIQVFIVKLNKKVIGGSVVLSYHNFAEDCWLSTLSEYNYLYTGVLLYWEMIKSSIKNNKRYFSFGRSSKNSSLLNFKRQWNPIEKEIYFSYSEEQKIGLKKMKFLTKIWKRMPLSVANLVGPKIADRLY